MIARILTQLKNRLLQVVALYVPGARTVRVWLHRMRGVRIGEEVFIGTGVILETESPHLIAIGSRVVVSIRVVMVAHFKGKVGVRIDDEVFIGPGAIVLPGVSIGRGSVVTAGSVVTKSVPARTMVQGNPARPVARCELPLTLDTSLEAFQSHLRPISDRR